MKFGALFILILSVLSLFIGVDARPKIPVNAIKKGARVVVSTYKTFRYLYRSNTSNTYLVGISYNIKFNSIGFVAKSCFVNGGGNKKIDR